LEYKALTGLTAGQLNTLALLIARDTGPVVKPGGKPPVIGLFHSVVMVVALMRRNLVQAAAGEIFGCSQPTVSRRWDLLRPVIARVLAGFIPDPASVTGRAGTALVDGTVCPTWDWHSVPDLFSAKAGYPGMNIQVAANLDGEVAAIGPVPVHGARHDAYAYGASGLKRLLEQIADKAADLGYIGVDGINIVPFKRASGQKLNGWQGEFNTYLSKARAAVEHAVAKVKSWRMSARKEAATAAR
jgi:DDE superfamily endonuclease